MKWYSEMDIIGMLHDAHAFQFTDKYNFLKNFGDIRLPKSILYKIVL